MDTIIRTQATKYVEDRFNY